MKIILFGFCLLSFLPLSAQDSLTILFAGDAMMHQKQFDNTQRGAAFDLDGFSPLSSIDQLRGNDSSVSERE